jgi:uncharacterized small protein (DUF1192 family)
MAIFDDDNPFGAEVRKKPTHHEIGQLLDALSLDELNERIDMLKTEIARLEQASRAKEASKNAADAFFKSGGG